MIKFENRADGRRIVAQGDPEVLGISRGYVSACIGIMYDILIEDIATEKEKLREERRELEQEKEEHRRSVEEIKKVKNKLSKLEAENKNDKKELPVGRGIRIK